MNQLQRNLLQDFFNLILSHYPNLPINLLHDFVNTYKETKGKKEKTPKTNKKNIISTNNSNTDNDIISELVNLANGTDYGTPTATPVTTEAPGAPVKETRKYNSNKRSSKEVTTKVVHLQPSPEYYFIINSFKHTLEFSRSLEVIQKIYKSLFLANLNLLSFYVLTTKIHLPSISAQLNNEFHFKMVFTLW